MDKQEILFKAGDEYFAYRIPVLATTSKGTLLAFCEARMGSASDHATIDLVYKRKEKGKEWSSSIKLKGNNVDTFHNPCLIIDDDKVHLLYAINYLQAFHCVSYDDGLTFVEEKEITSVYPKLPSAEIAIGPCAGIKFNGKLIVPSWVVLGNGKNKWAMSFEGVLYSENGGKDWAYNPMKVETAPSPNESMLVVLPSGKVLINCRHNGDVRRRLVLESDDGINYYNERFDETLTEQRVMASIISTPDGIMFSNPAYCETFNDWKDRKGLAIRLSTDECKTWQYTRTVCEDWASYSHLGRVDEQYYLLYETNLRDGNAMDLVLFTFDKNWIKGE